MTNKTYTIEAYEKIKPYGKVRYNCIGAYAVQAHNKQDAKRIALENAYAEQSNKYVSWDKVSVVIKSGNQLA